MQQDFSETEYPCSSCSFFRIGAIILALHDASDVLLEAAKVFKYSERELAASVFFGFFAISWLLLRLIFFPFWVIRASRSVLYIDVFPEFNAFIKYLKISHLICLLM